MHGVTLWVLLGSYALLWLSVLALILFSLGLLRQQGELRQAVRAASAGIVPVERDGPEVGALIPNLVHETLNERGKVSLRQIKGGRLIVLMAPGCKSCQSLVPQLNTVANERAESLSVVVIMNGERDSCETFLELFPMTVPVFADVNGEITKTAFGVKRNSFGLLYDGSGALIRKGVIWDLEHLQALLGGHVISNKVRENVYPPDGPYLVA